MQKSHLELVLGKEKLDIIKKSNILVIGVGGIGCEFIKNLSKSGFRKFTILDLDHIESTNLNRQFYFREQHIGLGKAVVGRESVLNIDPSLQITAINGNIYDKQYDCKFYCQFDVIVSALDNMKAREHLARMAIINRKPLVDAGTQAYNGQAKPNIRFTTDCHNCVPAKSEESFATCTIRSRPERPIHCAVFAKAFYDSFFGGEGTHSLKGSISHDNYVKKAISEHSDEELQKIGIDLFEQLFNHTINQIDDDGKKIPLIRKIKYRTAIGSQGEVENPTMSTYKEEEYLAQQNSKYEEEKLWSLKTYAERFVSSIRNLLIKKGKGQAPIKFQKDDNDCAMLIACIMNLRTANFLNPMSERNKHKFLTFYQCKDMAGKIQPAIASTNSIAAALEIRELVNILSGELHKMKYISIKNFHHQKLNPLGMSGPNLDCAVCSGKAIYASLECNIEERTFGQFQDFAKQHFFSYGRACMCGVYEVLQTEKPGSSDPNRQKKLNFAEKLVSPNGVLELSFNPITNFTPLYVSINILHNPTVTESFKIVNTPTKSELRMQILDYHRKKHNDVMEGRILDIDDYGYM